MTFISDYQKLRSMEPASSIIRKLGGPAVVAKVARTAYTAPYRWQHPVKKGGTGGLIPHKHIPKLLEFARDKGIELSADEFFTQPEATK